MITLNSKFLVRSQLIPAWHFSATFDYQSVRSSCYPERKKHMFPTQTSILRWFLHSHPFSPCFSHEKCWFFHGPLRQIQGFLFQVNSGVSKDRRVSGALVGSLNRPSAVSWNIAIVLWAPLETHMIYWLVVWNILFSIFFWDNPSH